MSKCRSVLMVLLVTVLSATAARPMFAAGGVIAPELAEKIAIIFPKGTKPDQVRALCGEAEFVNQFSSNIVVWRYVSADNYVLFSFENGVLAATATLPRAGRTLAALPESASAHGRDDSNRRLTWRDLYGERGAVLGARIGSSQADTLRALAGKGLAVGDISCETEPSQPAVVTCMADAEGGAWKRLDPSEVDSMFLLMFEDDRLRLTAHLVPFPDLATVTAAQTQVRAVFANAFQKPAQKLGFWRRKISSMLMPMASVAEGAKWEYATITASVARGKIGSRRNELPALLITVAENGDD